MQHLAQLVATKKTQLEELRKRQQSLKALINKIRRSAWDEKLRAENEALRASLAQRRAELEELEQNAEEEELRVITLQNDNEQMKSEQLGRVGELEESGKTKDGEIAAARADGGDAAEAGARRSCAFCAASSERWSGV